MKQLLDVTRDSYVIVGLNDRVFVGRCCAGRNVRHSNSVDPDPASPDVDEANDAFPLYELDLRGGITGSTSTMLPENASPANRNGPNGDASEKHPLQVQAVTISKLHEHDLLVCGVACYNKRLLMFEIDIRCADSATSQSIDRGVVIVPPKAVHETFKRCCCLCFASVPADETSSEASHGMLTLIAGDLTGDALAFPFTPSDVNHQRVPQVATTSASSEGTECGDSVRDVPKDCRLLLGHTASMLTGVRVACTSDERGRVQRRILTSDRDEKVRVSAFPDTFRIEGYLLGHEAFVSALDVAMGERATRCVTCGGDGTVRLWDFVTCRQLAQYSPATSNEDILVPSRVAINSTGDQLAVIFDESPRMDVLTAAVDRAEELRLVCSFDLSSPALSITWLDGAGSTLIVLLKEPPFLLRFRFDPSSRRPIPALNEPMVSTLSKAIAGETVEMPSSVLEKDQSGKLTMAKNREKRRGTPALEMPWNNGERKIIAKEREKRYKKSKSKAEAPLSGKG